jgi:hypothetical protein
MTKGEALELLKTLSGVPPSGQLPLVLFSRQLLLPVNYRWKSFST